MKDLIESIEQLKNSDISNVIETRMKEFSSYLKAPIEDIFTESCFCVMTANCSAEKCIEIHEKINKDFLKLSQEQLSQRFKELGYRFPNLRAAYICENQNFIQNLEDNLNNHVEEEELREWIVKNMKGLGYKEASHFLRNIGFKNYAIVDFHIIDVLAKYNLIEKPKTLTKRKYLEIEEKLNQLAGKLNLNLAELDLYLWYLETGKILK